MLEGGWGSRKLLGPDDYDEAAEGDQEWNDYWDGADWAEEENFGKWKGVKTDNSTAFCHQESGTRDDVLRLTQRINTNPLPTHTMSHEGEKSACASIKKNEAHKNLGLTKDDRRTVEQVLDPRTMLTMSKMMKRGVFKNVEG